MPEKKYRTQNIVLEEQDHAVVMSVVEERSLGGKGFSAALRQIIREWNALTGNRYVLTPEGRAALKEVQEAQA